MPKRAVTPAGLGLYLLSFVALVGSAAALMYGGLGSSPALVWISVGLSGSAAALAFASMLTGTR